VIVSYISKFKEIAMANMRNYGIPASIILAQGILESGAGRGDLASANNHFESNVMKVEGER
jgi:flagellum-specific peptidoglycan hydrolase FlgJ